MSDVNSKTEYDLNDPASWPDDIDDLADLAEGGEDDNPQNSSEASAEQTEGSKETAEEKPEETAEEKSEGESEESAEGKTEEPTEDKAEESGEEEAPVATKDGKHTLPYSVLRAERDAKKALAERNDALEAELRELREGAKEATGTKSEEPDSPTKAQQTEIDAKVEQIRDEWGDDIAESYRRTFELEAVVKQQQEIINNLQESTTSREQAEQQSLEQTVQNAIDNNPTLADWQSQEDGVWYARATATHKMLMDTDPDYAEKPWDERFADLATRVQSLYGGAAPKPQQKDAQKETTEPADKAVKAAKEKAGEKPPLSMSEVPTGETPESGSEFEKMERMSPSEVQAKIDALADDPDRLEAFLRSVA